MDIMDYKYLAINMLSFYEIYIIIILKYSKYWQIFEGKKANAVERILLRKVYNAVQKRAPTL